MKLGDLIVCAKCGISVPAKSPTHRFCEACSDSKAQARRDKWRSKHRGEHYARHKDLISEREIAERELRKEAGRAFSTKESLGWDASREIDLLWMVRVSVPFHYGFSKNYIYGIRNRGHVFLRRESRGLRDALILRIRGAMRDRKIARNKVWIDILVQKPNHKGDAVNVVDTVCDALKAAIDLDDRWFSIRRLDWEISKNDPRLYVGIGQESEDIVSACSACGRLLSFDHFPKSKSTDLGISRECKECRNVARRAITVARAKVRGEHVPGSLFGDSESIEERNFLNKYEAALKRLPSGNAAKVEICNVN